MKLRIASYNVENLFRRAAILNIRDSARTDALLDQVRVLQGLLDRATYDAPLKDKVFAVSHELLLYLDVRKDAGSLGDWKKESGLTGFRINKSCKGRGDWLGQIVFKDQEFNDQQRKNTGKVIKALNADILCAVEVEGMDVLRSFNSQILGSKKFKQFVMIDSPNDPRGIDVACLTRHKIASVRTHVFDAGKVFNPVFSRDCLEVAIDAGLSRPVYVLCNHFKSQNGKTAAEKKKSAEKRLDQSNRVADILTQTYDLKKDYVVVVGDLNEDAANPLQSLAPLFAEPGLTPVIDPAQPVTDRYTYYFEGGPRGERLNQLDYIFLSQPLTRVIKASGIERRGIFDIQNIARKEGAPAQTGFAEVTSWDNGASDHAGVWVEVAVT